MKSIETSVAHWSAVFSLFAGVTSLIAAEFIPVSLLTPIASTLQISEGMAGQTVTAVGICSVISSLLLVPATKMFDRRMVLLALSLLLIVSDVLVAMAPNYFILLIGRGLLGFCVGGFWSMASAVTIKLVPAKDITRALSIVYAGVSFATIISLPLASYLGYFIGWRNVFYASAVLAVFSFIWQIISLPSLPPQKETSFKNMFGLLKEPWIALGIAATIFSFAGYHFFFTYLRPFLEHTLALSATRLSILLLLFGIANCLGTVVAGIFMKEMYRNTMISVHVILLIFSGTFILYFENSWLSQILVILWGFMFGFIPVGWSTWIVRTLANKSEMIGGLSVAAIQFSIGTAAAIGGSIYDHNGIEGVFVSSSLAFLCAIFLMMISFSLFTGKRLRFME